MPAGGVIAPLPPPVGGLLGEVLLLEHDVPAVVAVGAAVDHDVARFPTAVLRFVRDEVGAAAAVDARDLGGGRRHRGRASKRATPSRNPPPKMTSRPWRSSLARPSASSIPSPSYTLIRSWTTAGQGDAAICSARALAVSRAVPSGTTRAAKPMS